LTDERTSFYNSLKLAHDAPPIPRIVVPERTGFLCPRHNFPIILSNLAHDAPPIPRIVVPERTGFLCPRYNFPIILSNLFALSLYKISQLV